MYNIHRYDNCESRDIDIRYIIEIAKQGMFDLPNSQREKEWVPEQNEKFILSVLQNKPIGTIILNKKGNKKYILDGQHRVNAIEQFYKDNFGIKIDDNYIYYDAHSLNSKNKTNKYKVFALDDDWKKTFLETKIFIIEYNNLLDNEMADIIESVNEGIKNDCDFLKSDKTIDNEIKINILYNNISRIIYNSDYDKLRYIEREEIKKHIGYVGNIIDNFDNYESNDDYKQLNIKQTSRYMIKLKREQNFEALVKNIIDFIKILYLSELMKHKDITYLIDKYEINNYQLNAILYKIYEKYMSDNIKDNIKDNINKIRKTLIYMLNNNKQKFKELLDTFDKKYNE
jgi:hypothetical protein